MNWCYWTVLLDHLSYFSTDYPGSLIHGSGFPFWVPTPRPPVNPEPPDHYHSHSPGPLLGTSWTPKPPNPQESVGARRE